MRKKLAILLLVIMVSSLSSIVLARTGVGIVWTSQTEKVVAGENKCLSYGIYNPWEEDVDAKITVTGELEEVVQNLKSDTTLIPANTPHEEAKDVELCFKVPNVYKRDCLLLGTLCEQSCGEEEKNYSGEVLVLQEQEGDGSGSATAVGVTAPLTLKVTCQEYDRDYRGLVILMLVATLGAYFVKRR